MERDYLKLILDGYRQGRMDLDQAIERLRILPYEDLDFVRIDHHRTMRQGIPEVIFSPGKTTDQILTVVDRLLSVDSNVLITRTNESVYQAISDTTPDAVYHEAAKAITIVRKPSPPKAGIIAVVTAGTSDIPVAAEAIVTAELLGNHCESYYDVGVAGIHRLFSVRQQLDEARVVICVAGMEGALPSVVGGLVSVPVIAVPTSVGYGSSFAGMAALLSMLNSCSANVTVVNIDNGFGAGVVANLINR